MRQKKVFVGGGVDPKLKKQFLQELKNHQQANGVDSNSNITQSRFLEVLLAESVAERRSRAKNPDGSNGRTAD